MTSRVLVPACLYIATGFHVPAEAQFIKEGSIGKPPAAQSEPQAGSCAFRPLSKMKGERLLFLPSPKSLQQYGYQEFEGGTGEYGHPTYKEAVGRIGVLTDIAVKPSIIGGEEYTVRITMEGNHKVYTHKSLPGEPESLSGVAFVSGLECAKKQLLGKTIWYIGAGTDQNGIKVYDEAIDKTTKLDFPKPIRLQVKEVVASWFADSPVRLIVETNSGSEAFADTSLSGINVAPKWFSPFEDSFTLEDPRKLYKWPEKVWQAIREHKVYVGMTQQQVAFSWGKPMPDHIKSTTTANGKSEQWHYAAQARNLYFEDGVLTAMQNN
jgi:hypothetical protein